MAASSGDSVLRPVWWAADPAQPGAGGGGGLQGAGGVAGEPALVHDLGDEVADVGVHAPRHVEQDPAIGWEGPHPFAEQVLEGADPGAVGVAGLGDLGQLLRVAEQDHVRGRDGGREGVGQAELAGLVDDQHVDGVVAHRLAGEQPGGPGDDVVGPGGTPTVVVDVGDASDGAGRCLAHGAQVVAGLSEPLHHLLGEVVDRVVAHCGDADPLALLDQGADHVGTGVGLARARWPLDGHVAGVQVPRPGADLRAVADEHAVRGSVAGGEPRGVAAQDRVADRGRIPGEHPVGQVGQRRQLGALVEVGPVDQAGRRRAARDQVLVREHRERPRVGVDRVDVEERPLVLSPRDDQLGALPDVRVDRLGREGELCRGLGQLLAVLGAEPVVQAGEGQPGDRRG